MRLDKVLSNFGFGSRSEIKKLAKDGLIRVDGSTAKDTSMHVDPENNRIEIKGTPLNYRRYIYIMMNKPAGIISATVDNKHRTVIDLLPDEFSCFNLFPAGRLDIDTEGMLLLTNDGQMAHELLSPKKHVDKRYCALIEGEVTDEDVKRFNDGIILEDGYKTMPAELEIINSGTHSEIELTLHEGKFHQVKRMFEATGKKVTYLKRIRIGGLQLDDALNPGECRELTSEEVALLKGTFRGDVSQLQDSR